MPSIGYGRDPADLFIENKGQTSRMMQSDVRLVSGEWLNLLMSDEYIPFDDDPFLHDVSMQKDPAFKSAKGRETSFDDPLGIVPGGYMDFEPTPVARVAHRKSVREDPETRKYDAHQTTRAQHSHDSRKSKARK